jgi:hypothetical protein
MDDNVDTAKAVSSRDRRRGAAFSGGDIGRDEQGRFGKSSGELFAP